MQPLHIGVATVLGQPHQIPLRAPPPHLSLQIPAGLAEVGQADGVGIDIVEVDEHPDQRVHAAADDGVAERLELGAAAHHLAGNEFDDLERGAQHRIVFAQPDRARHRNRRVLQRSDHPVLAGHVVGRRRQPVQRRSAHQPAGRVVVDAERQVGAATGNELRP